MIKVLIVCSEWPFPESKNGVAKIVANLLNSNPYFCADLLYVGEKKLLADNKFKIYNVATQTTDTKLNKLFSILFSSLPYCASKIGKSLESIKDILNLVHTNYQVIHLIGPELALLSRYSGEIFYNKIIFTPVDSIGLHFNRRKSIQTSLLKSFFFWLESLKADFYEKNYYFNFKKVSFVSHVDLLWVGRKNSFDKFLSIPNGVDINYFKSKRNEGLSTKPIIMFTGNMNYSPNVDAAIFLIDEIFPLVEKSFDCDLYIVGSNPTIDLVKRQKANIKITGFVEDINVYLDMADVYISPLREGSGIKNKVLEAMSMSRNVVGTSISFEGIKIENNVHCQMVELDAVKIADTICTILRNPAKFSYMKKNARDLVVSQYSWPIIYSKYAELYRSIN